MSAGQFGPTAVQLEDDIVDRLELIENGVKNSIIFVLQSLNLNQNIWRFGMALISIDGK